MGSWKGCEVQPEAMVISAVSTQHTPGNQDGLEIIYTRKATGTTRQFSTIDILVKSHQSTIGAHSDHQSPSSDTDQARPAKGFHRQTPRTDK